MQVTYNERYDGLQLKLEFKTLQSGRRQVKFYTKDLTREAYYGYALVDENKNLQQVVAEIKRKLSNIGSIGNYYQQNLYSIRRDRYEPDSFVIFKAG